jgi:hypothetical protein
MAVSDDSADPPQAATSSNGGRTASARTPPF